MNSMHVYSLVRDMLTVDFIPSSGGAGWRLITVQVCISTLNMHIVYTQMLWAYICSRGQWEAYHELNKSAFWYSKTLSLHGL